VQQPVIHRASWVVPVSDPAIADGAVVADNDRIVAVGRFHELSEIYPDAPINDHGRSALIPALVNAHIHLELSHIPLPALHKKITGFTGWIETLLAMRAELGDMGHAAEEAAKQVMLRQHRLGVIALGDIGNTDMGTKLACEFPGLILHFHEHLGRTTKTRRAILERVAAAPQDKLFTAHAPYSTHAELIRELKRRASALGHPFPIHVAESPSENEMLRRGSGELYTFLRKRGFIDDSYKPPAAIDNQGSVQYLHGLGALDKQTICVHCVHVTPGEAAILAETGATICLCPGSNRYLRVGKAPVGLFLQNRLRPALGTDSMASNPELSIWREMNILREDHPEINAADIFRMATLGGATALGIDEYYGSLARGKSARFLSIPLEKEMTDETMLYNLLTATENIQPIWVNGQ
jgi:cytosine/adenosine deaminase-related metal-dependent hydrolase